MTNQLAVQIVEDDPIIGLDLKKALEGFGYRVNGPISSGEEAVSEAKKSPPDLILMDINLRGEMDGIGAATAIGKNKPTPIIFLTADTDEKTLQRAMLTIPYGYLIKPFDPFELRSTIEIAAQRVSAGEMQPEAIETFEEIRSEEPDEKLGVLNNIPLLKSLPPNIRHRLAERAIIRQHDSAETLVSPEKEEAGGFIPLSGRISITRVSDAGKELVVALVGPGDIFGMFYGLDSFNGSSWAQTQVPSRVLWLPSALLRSLLDESPELLKILSEELARRLVHAHKLSTSLAHSRVEDRITMMLFALLEEFGKDTGKADTGRVYITRRELADLVGTTPETAIRVTKSLEREGLLDLTRPGIIKVPSVSKFRSWSDQKHLVS